MTDREAKARELIAKGTLAVGQLAKDPREAINVLAQTAAGLVRGDGAATFVRVFDNLATKGEIDSQFGKTSKGRYFIQEINDVISNETRDEQIVITKIKLFAAIASKKYKDNSEDEAKEVWTIIKSLDTKDIRVLAVAYQFREEDNPQKVNHFQSQEGWIDFIAKESGLKYKEFVDESRGALSTKRLLSGDFNTNYYLSPLGICVAEYLAEGERLFKLTEAT